MAEQTYLMNAKEVADVLDCSVDYAYKVIREMNEDVYCKSKIQKVAAPFCR